MRRVLVLSHTYPLDEESGITPFVHQTSREAARQGNDVHVLVPEHDDLQEFDAVTMHTFDYSDRDAVEYHGVPGETEDIPPTEVVKFVAGQFRAAGRLHREHGFDLVHAHWAAPSGASALGLKLRHRIPYLVHVHGRDVYNEPAYGYDVPSDVKARAAIRMVLSRADHVLANSRETLDRAAALGADRSRGSVLPFGVDLERFSPGNADPALRPDCCGDGDTFLLYAGRLVERKGVQDLIAAVERCDEGVCLGIVGRGPYRDALEKQAAGMDSVAFLGYQPHSRLAAYMATADVAAVPSRVEPFGIVTIEALASGTPVVGADTGGMHDILDEAVGRRFPPGDVDALAGCIDELARDSGLRAELGDAARERAEQTYTWARFGKKLEDVYSAI